MSWPKLKSTKTVGLKVFLLQVSQADGFASAIIVVAIGIGEPPKNESIGLVVNVLLISNGVKSSINAFSP